MYFILYKADGAIVKKIGLNCHPDDFDSLLNSTKTKTENIIGEPLYSIKLEENIVSELYYVESGEILEKGLLQVSWNKTSILANGVDEAILSNLPIPCTVYVDTDEYRVLDGSFEFSSEFKGFYSIKVVHPKFIKSSWEIEVV